jgi:adenylate kinase family enzyme
MRIDQITNLGLDEGVHDPHIFKAVFMAGAAGAGKTTIANKLFSGTGLKPLNVDKFWPLYMKKGKPHNYEKFWTRFEIQRDRYFDGRLGLLIDGTAKNSYKMGEVNNKLIEMGYDTAMVFVHVDLETAIERARIRAQTPGKDYKRDVPIDFITDTWVKTQQAVDEYQQMFGNDFFLLDNSDGEENDLPRVERLLRRWLAKPPTSPAAKQWIEDNLPN